MASIAANARAAYSETGNAFRLACAALGLLVLLGLYGFIRQTVEGHALTGLSDYSPWGLYIAGFVFFVGASAGSTIVGLMMYAFNRKDFSPLGTRAILVGFLSLVAAVLFIAVDVGQVARMWRVPVLWQNPTSMFFYTSTTYYLFAFILLGELYYTVKLTQGKGGERDKTMAKWLAIAAVPFALVVVHAPHGALFAVIKAREFWNTALLPPHFAVVALVSGTALMIVVTVATAALGKRELVSKRTLATMGVLLAFFIATAAFLDFFDFLVSAYGDKPASEKAWRFLTGSHLAFSIVHVVGYIAALAILLTRRGREVPRLTVAAAVALIAVAAYRYNLTTVGLSVPLYSFLREQHYWPSTIELMVTVGIVALVTLAYLVLTRILPMEEDSGAARAQET